MRHPPVGVVPLPIWPAEEYCDTEEFASSSEWDEALAGYSQEDRAAAKIRVLKDLVHQTGGLA